MAAKKSKARKKGNAKQHINKSTAASSTIDPFNSTPEQGGITADIAAAYAGTPEEKKTGILDLPAELRNHIYALAFAGTWTWLDMIRFPAVLQVNRQIRSEALAHFFAETQFRFFVGSDFDNWAHRRKYGTSCYRGQRENSRAGTLGLPSDVRYALNNSYGQHAVFRNVLFKTFEGDHYWINKNPDVPRFPAHDWHQICMMNLRFNSEASEKVSLASDITWHLGERVYRFEERDIADVLDAFEKKVHEVGDKDGFKGFTLADLELIAKTLCSVPNESGKKDDVLRSRRTRVSYKQYFEEPESEDEKPKKKRAKGHL